MRLIVLSHITMFLSLSICACSQTLGEQPAIPQRTDTTMATQAPVPTEIPIGAQALMDNYPTLVKGYQDNHLLLTNGKSLLYDDKREKSFIERMDEADVEDMFSQPYDTSVWLPARNYDPGRIRNEELMKEMYGHNEQEVRKHLVRVKWFKQQLLFSSLNGAADSLAAVAKELAELPASFQKYFDNSSTFYWRTVRGSKRLSAHSFGIVIDICTKFSDYWRWKNPGKGEEDSLKYTNRIPKEIIQIFEKHGFISGARWYHFDTMHFEFRPDLLQASRHQTNN
ncbi:MAG: M15 family metallopeptidase [Paludibacteraceae bacterium]|nr:M15 family metallopeptidase [Paludibacteraceae bacterium]MBP5481958.1 M15 family metallopeptidase [Paludibacteraceae bacterium]